MYRIFGEFQLLDAAELGARPLNGIWLHGIVNPYGPTLIAIALTGEVSPGAILPLVYLA
jgi:hypothetical protein